MKSYNKVYVLRDVTYSLFNDGNPTNMYLVTVDIELRDRSLAKKQMRLYKSTFKCNNSKTVVHKILILAGCYKMN